MGQNLVIVLEFDLEHGIRQGLSDHCHDLNRVFLRQTVSCFRRDVLAPPACLLSTRLKSSLRWRLPPPYAQNERSCFRPLPPRSIRRPIPGHPVCRHSPWARWRSPSPLAASCPVPLHQNSAPADLRACGPRCRDPQNPAPPKTLRPRLHLAPQSPRRPRSPPASPRQFPHAATLRSPAAAVPYRGGYSPPQAP